MYVIRVRLYDLDLLRLKFVVISISKLVGVTIRIPRSRLTFVHGVNDGRSVNASINFNLA
jgi:hypothetical protein